MFFSFFVLNDMFFLGAPRLYGTVPPPPGKNIPLPLSHPAYKGHAGMTLPSAYVRRNAERGEHSSPGEA